MRKVIEIIGLPGSGKTTLARKIAALLNAIHINADWARATVTSHLGFSPLDRVRQAATLGQMAALTVQNQWTVVDFVSPTAATRQAFLEAADPDTYGGGKLITEESRNNSRVFRVFLNTIPEGRFEDTNKLFEAPNYVPNVQVNSYMTERQFNHMAQMIVAGATAGMKEYHIRFNTLHNGSDLKWRIIDAATMEEFLATDFDIRGHLVPSMTVEHGIEKFNVLAKGFPRWEGQTFILEF